MITFEQKMKIRNIKQSLEDTDFKVLKCYEASVLGETLPYDIVELSKQRKQWRLELSELEFIIAGQK